MSVVGTRFGHVSGLVHLSYSPVPDSSSTVVTAGKDGELRVWQGFDDEDCGNLLVGEEATSLAVTKEKLLVGASDTNMVQAYSWDLDTEGVVTR